MLGVQQERWVFFGFLLLSHLLFQPCFSKWHLSPTLKHDWRVFCVQSVSVYRGISSMYLEWQMSEKILQLPQLNCPRTYGELNSHKKKTHGRLMESLKKWKGKKIKAASLLGFNLFVLLTIITQNLSISELFLKHVYNHEFSWPS